MRRPNLTIKEQIDYMEIEKGILFNITTKEEAFDFLNNNNYYFKLKSYAKNYDRYLNGDKKDKYINLEFAYLQELSRLDMYFRKFIIKMTLDIEHFAKTKLIKDCSENKLEDGYSIVADFIIKYPYIEKGIIDKSNSSNSVCSDLIKKYSDELAIWNLVEILSFGDFIKLYSFYYQKYPNSDSMVNHLWSVKFLRNAAAHNSCLLNTLKSPYTGVRANKQINTYVSKINGVKKEERIKKLKNPIIHDFVVTLYVFDYFTKNNNTKYSTFKELKDLIDTRFIENKDYFIKNQIIVTHYNFIKKIVDYFYSNCI